MKAGGVRSLLLTAALAPSPLLATETADSEAARKSRQFIVVLACVNGRMLARHEQRNTRSGVGRLAKDSRSYASQRTAGRRVCHRLFGSG
jgi:hypothetical protein